MQGHFMMKCMVQLLHPSFFITLGLGMAVYVKIKTYLVHTHILTYTDR